MGCLGEGQKVGKGRDQGVLEKDHYGAQDKGMSGAGDAHTGFSPVPFPGPALHLTPALSLAFVWNPISNSFPERGHCVRVRL